MQKSTRDLATGVVIGAVLAILLPVLARSVKKGERPSLEDWMDVVLPRGQKPEPVKPDEDLKKAEKQPS